MPFKLSYGYLQRAFAFIRPSTWVWGILLFTAFSTNVFGQQLNNRMDYISGWKRGYIRLSGGTTGGERGMLFIKSIGKVNINELEERWVVLRAMDKDGRYFSAVLEFTDKNEREFLKWIQKRFYTDRVKYVPCWCINVGTYTDKGRKIPIYSLRKTRPDNQFIAEKNPSRRYKEQRQR